jgi:hypothetical protein
MKYLYYIAVLVWSIVSKIIGVPMFYLLSPFRKWARNRVYNYWFDNDIFVVRFREREPKLSEDGTKIELPNAVPDTTLYVQAGYFNKVTVSKPVYWLAYFVWGWYDDDSTQETWCRGHNINVLKGQTDPWALWLPGAKKSLEDAVADTETYGRVFDMGDEATYSIRGWSTFIWILRNTAYNFSYASDIDDESKVWLIEFPSIKIKRGHLMFGWEASYNKYAKNNTMYTHRFIANF